ncbi:hypothetical protein C5C31_07050 [Rathayibacter rathayi]|uniref:hypothetical protein n=1 Tax=Rathayibacter rathayi TaxID=33887 RepID=UPI000CE77510|nr:hypothetical protein [Rathayibacter rathayi]PPG69433.1 hypothetical protein C5C02_06180 [Rathayibacter rathayi]PPG77194.1 hypothetical protein C5C23_05775 [Rathayibacter rathayi]PPH24051.1 hypothetical protein C5C31_07050 [Rathayibacter rathayi]PPI77770.1 hypothetical protein C5E03_02595 [Rathayibacter rathayi]
MMDNDTGFQRLSEIQEEIIAFTWEQVGDKVEKFYIEGKISDDASGNITQYSGNLKYSIADGKVLNNSDVLAKEEFRENVRFVQPRIVQLHDILRELQGKSPVRFRWAVDTKTGQVESDWTYYDDLTDEEKKDNFWQNWKGDFAWKAQLEAELAGE